MRGEKSRRGRRSTTKKGRTAVWDIGRRRSLLHRWGRLSPATLCWLRRPQPQTRSRKVSYDLVREERGQVIAMRRLITTILLFLSIYGIGQETSSQTKPLSQPKNQSAQNRQA